MKVLVTGGLGYVGSWVVAEFVAGGHEVRVVDVRLSRPQTWWPTVEVVHCDVRDRDGLKIAAVGCDAIIHLAAIVGFPRCDAEPGRARSVNVDGTRSVLGVADGRPVVVASTMSCLGRVPDLECDEQTVPSPLSLYGRTKLAAERFALDYGAVVLRPATAFGVSPRMRSDLLVHTLVSEAEQTGCVRIYEPGVTRSFVHVRDLATSFVHSVKVADGLGGEVVHVGDDSLNVTKMELASMVRQATGCTITVHSNGHDVDGRDVRGNFDKARRIGICVRYSLRDGIAELVALRRAVSTRLDGVS